MKWFNFKYLRLLILISFFLLIGNLFSQVFFLVTNSNFTELLPEKDRKRLIFLSNKNKENADYIYSNRIYDVNIYLDDKYNLSRNFEKQKQLMIDGALVYEIYKRKGL